MKLSANQSKNICLAIALALITSAALPTVGFAKQGATDPIAGTSNGGTSTGGKKGGSTTTTTTTTVQPIVTAALTFTASGPINGVVPQVSGNYRIDPYYPTLSLITVNVSCNSVNLPDNSSLNITVSSSGGTLYPFTASAFTVVGQVGSGTVSLYCTPGTTIQSVSVTDASGNLVAVGN